MDSTESEDDQHHTGGVFNLTLGELLEIAGDTNPRMKTPSYSENNIHPETQLNLRSTMSDHGWLANSFASSRGRN